jgi:hypothetical protein
MQQAQLPIPPPSQSEQRVTLLVTNCDVPSLGLIFASSEGEHVVLQSLGLAAQARLRVGDIIVDINHRSVHGLTHAEVAGIITTAKHRGCFCLTVTRTQTSCSSSWQPDQTLKHWFIKYCRRCGVERGIIESSLRLQRATDSHLPPKIHLMLCARIMIKWMDDCLAVTDLCKGAGARFTLDEWMTLEFDLCEQVAWNLRFFCFSSSSSSSANSTSSAPKHTTGRTPAPAPTNVSTWDSGQPPHQTNRHQDVATIQQRPSGWLSGGVHNDDRAADPVAVSNHHPPMCTNHTGVTTCNLKIDELKQVADTLEHLSTRGGGWVAGGGGGRNAPAGRGGVTDKEAEETKKVKPGIYTFLRTSYRAAFATCVASGNGSQSMPMSPFL